MRCGDFKAGVAHDTHWHTVMADNIAIAGGWCPGYDFPVRPDTLCSSKIARRYGSAQCDLEAAHRGMHVQHSTGITWTTEQAIESWLDDSV